MALPSGTTELTYALASPRDGRIRRLRKELLLSKTAETDAKDKQPDEELGAWYKELRVHRVYDAAVEQPKNSSTTRQQSTDTPRRSIQTEEL